MALDLSTYKEIACAVIVRITIEDYRTTPSGTYTPTVLRFSDSRYPVTVEFPEGNETFVSLGNLVGISSSRSELSPSLSQLTVTIAGVPDSAIAEIMNSRLKGSKVEIYRVILNATTGAVLDIEGNPAGRFFGIVDNFSFDEIFDAYNSTNTISIMCTSHLSFLQNKIQGRRTNPIDEHRLYPGDKSFDRVPSLVGAWFDFGEGTTTPQQ